MLHKARLAATLFAMTAILSLSMAATAQQDDGDGAGLRAQFAGMQRAGGEITAIAGNKVTVKSTEGDTVQIVTTDNTRIMKGRGVTVKMADLKVGDGVMAAGNLDAPNKTLHAAILFATDAAEVKKLRDNLGKTYIAGKVTAIDLDNAKMTVERPDKVSQTIGFNETTSFKRGGRGGGGGFGSGAAAPAAADAGESITLADIKVGDNVHGTGSVKGGTFVPTQLNVSTPGQHRRSNGVAAPAPTAAPQK
jgi:predicted RNA-binding protein